MEIAGSRALVSGGGSGLGAATARQLSRVGATVYVADRNEESAMAIAEEINGIAIPLN